MHHVLKKKNKINIDFSFGINQRINNGFNDKLRSVGQEGLAERLVGRPNMINKPRKNSPNYKGGNQISSKPKTKHINRTKVETIEDKPMPKWLADKRKNQTDGGNSNSSRNKKKSRTGKKR